MISNTYAAFGKILYIVSSDIGEVHEIILGEDGLYNRGIYFYLTGGCTVYMKETGEVLQERTAGWLSSEHPNAGANTSGTLVINYLPDTTWVCIPYLKNDTMPVVKSVCLESNTIFNMTNNTNIFLVDGELIINKKSFKGPTQIRIRSGDVTSIANTTVKALLFN